MARTMLPRRTRATMARRRQPAIIGAIVSRNPFHDLLGQVVAAVLLHEVAAPEAFVGLVLGAGDVLLQRAVGGAEDRVVLAEEGEEGFGPAAEHVPGSAVGGDGRVRFGRGDEAREDAGTCLVR